MAPDWRSTRHTSRFGRRSRLWQQALLLPFEMDITMDSQLFVLEWDIVLNNLIHILVAFLIALPIGWEREDSGTGMGLRTFPLVALASCGYLLVARDLAGGNPDAESRVIQGLLGGIGFIGGGAILKEGGTVRGTATAASIWNTGAIGLAVAFDHLEIAIVLGLINFLALQWLTPFKDAVEPDSDNAQTKDAND